MALTALLGPLVAGGRWVGGVWRWRRKVTLTVHTAYLTDAIVGWAETRALSAESPDVVTAVGGERYFITVTNASPQQEIEVTHVWFATDPPVNVPDRELPVRLKYSQRWETHILMSKVPAEREEALWLARCQLSPDDKVIESKPRENVPSEGVVPRARTTDT